jgi:hypothetical protein
MTTTAEDEAQLEKAQAEQIIADTPLFEGVRSITVELGNDFDGDPAMWLIYHLDPDLETTDDWHTRFSQFNSSLSLRIIDRGVKRFPYSRLRNAA